MHYPIHHPTPTSDDIIAYLRLYGDRQLSLIDEIHDRLYDFDIQTLRSLYREYDRLFSDLFRLLDVDNLVHNIPRIPSQMGKINDIHVLQSIVGTALERYGICIRLAQKYDITLPPQITNVLGTFIVAIESKLKKTHRETGCGLPETLQNKVSQQVSTHLTRVH